LEKKITFPPKKPLSQNINVNVGAGCHLRMAQLASCGYRMRSWQAAATECAAGKLRLRNAQLASCGYGMRSWQAAATESKQFKFDITVT